VYGRQKKFQTIPLAIEVYKFANKMMMNLLEKALDTFFFENVKNAEIFALLDLYNLMDNKEGMKFCTKVKFHKIICGIIQLTCFVF
jgi:hypothetical protein